MFLAGLTRNCVRVEMTGADIPGTLSLCSRKGITVSGIKQKDVLTVTFWISQTDLPLLETVCRKSGASINRKQTEGFNLLVSSLCKRPVLIGIVVILLFLSLWLPERILIIFVEGNAAISSKEILTAAQSCGLSFGVSRSEVRSEAMKNALLDKIPQLQWAGINTKGCTATISVREKEEENEKPLPGTVSSLVAIRDGIVVTGTATAGQLQCKPGQAVRKGEVLVSGYTDCGISVRAEQAKGEVFAITVRPLDVVAPLNYRQKGAGREEIKNISLIIGKKRINLSKDSGISYTSCDKIRMEYALTLPGGFVLPVTLLVDSYVLWDTQAAPADGPDGSSLSRNMALDYLLENMIAGEILDMTVSEITDEQSHRLEGIFLCSEMIARECNEEILEEYGKNRGEDR